MVSPGLSDPGLLPLARTQQPVGSFSSRRTRVTAGQGGTARRYAAATLLLVPSLTMVAGQAGAAKSDGCEGGGFTVRGLIDGTEVSADGETTIPAGNLGQRFLVDGLYVEFMIVSASFGIENWTFTGEFNQEDLTGGQRTVVWAAKTPDHKGLTLSGDVLVDRSGDDIVIERESRGLTMKIQAKDCAAGGIFQMEVERGDGTTTRITHILAEGAFYYDNPNFRARGGRRRAFHEQRLARTCCSPSRRASTSATTCRPGSWAGTARRPPPASPRQRGSA